ncbi:MAG: tRNA (guanine-N(1)-)-methyltransferase [candidate division TM6 bacterium GW2011_GWE2_41_16]|nr:MAG: tRNA (guanine-N(1)-)-methyltransferase [candidate division TM6 bacterium GW2011_GWE2_41_16]
MKISALTLFPSLYEPFFKTSLVGKAVARGELDCVAVSMLDACAPKERIDAPSCGHGAGMLLRPEAVERAIEQTQATRGKAFKIFFSPHGKKLDQVRVRELAAHIYGKHDHLMLVAARYEGMDARVEEEYADLILSVGDFVLMGGDLPAMVLLEALLRYMPGIVGSEESVQADSFSGALVDYPEYTHPIVWHDKEVPAVIRSGDHKAIAQWRTDKAAERTALQHFGWFRSAHPTEKEVCAVTAHIPHHYVALMHDHIELPGDRIGTTSVTSLDIHDIARSACTYGLEKYFIMTPLYDQQRIVKTLLDFWQTGHGVSYNNQRHVAVSMVELADSFEVVISRIEERESKRPLIVGTSARLVEQSRMITFRDQAKVWAHNRPVLFVLGTGRGLSEEFLSTCDYVLVPLEGMTHFNHLSVRSAAAIIFDRWLGLQPNGLQPRNV